MEKLPAITVKTTEDPSLSLDNLKGQNIVLYFYPKDNTPGCTTEANDFKTRYAEFKRLNAEVIGVSRDSLASHEKFINKYSLPFPLLSDDDQGVCEAFGVLKDKNMFGKKVRGIDRSTFLFNAQGSLIQSWRNVKVKGHVDEVLSCLARSLDQGGLNGKEGEAR